MPPSRLSSTLPRLILHFDVNKTLILSDSAGSRTTEDILKQSLQQSIYGTMKEHPSEVRSTFGTETKKSEGKIHSPPLEEHLLVNNWIENIQHHNENDVAEPLFDYTHHKYNHHKDFEHDTSHPHYMSLDTYIHEYLFPYRAEYPEGTSKALILEDRQKQKRERKRVTEKFAQYYYTHHRHAYDKLTEALKYENDKSCFILPAFFRLMLWLEENNRLYSIVFRTFGDMHDIEAITTEFNQFCRGEHPQFPHNVESLRTKIIDMDDKDSFGFFHRNDERTLLVLGEYNQPKRIDAEFRTQDEHKLHKVIRGEQSIYDYLMQATRSGKTLALRDFYSYWSWKGEKPLAGKVFLIDLEESTTLQIFFDDNVSIEGPQGRGIVDLRDAKTHKHLEPQSHYMGLYLQDVLPIYSITNPSYFIEAVVESEKRFLEEGKGESKSSMML
mmetsp:Transcript_269/g.914  ORF Transcript_269/g.914 Transcript_269/m.914 type:complete len:441 (-) Transcript_269:25-1347(-)